MRSSEIINEANLTAVQLVKHGGMYLNNLLTKIENGMPLSVTGKFQTQFGKNVILDPSSAAILKSIFYPQGNPALADISASGDVVMSNPTARIVLLTQDGKKISLSALEKTPDIKGKQEDYNLGDIGEIAIALAVYARFINQGQEVGINNFFAMGKLLQTSHSSKGSAGVANMNGTIQWPVGKTDNITLQSVLPRRSLDYFISVLKGDQKLEPQINSVFQSAIAYANQNSKVTAGIKLVGTNTNSNQIRIICDGVSDQKGTKADIIMDIDGKAINIVSAKVGRSQLGQASGHDFEKQIVFFATVFGIDVSPYKDQWGASLEEHDSVLSKIWSNINPRIMAALAGDITDREVSLVKQLANGLIKYSNTASPGDVDIVKLIATPGKPGYKLLRVDNKLYAALDKINLIAKPVAKGISIYGSYNGREILLMKARSYLSGAAKTVRTIIEGGNLLDIMAEVIDKK